MGQEALRSAVSFNSAAVFLLLLKRRYDPLITFYHHNHPKNKMSQKEDVDSISDNSTTVDTTSKNFHSSVEERKNSVHSFRVVDSQKETDSDKDLIIHSLHESLHIHKEILERIQTEKEEYKQHIEQEREDEQNSISSWKEASKRVLTEQQAKCKELENNIEKLRRELELKKEEYSKLEVNFYSYVKTIRVTDDDLSTIQPEISHLLSQLNNTCMGLKSKMDRQGGTQFVFDHWKDKAGLVKKYMLPAGEDLLDSSYITLFVEKYLINTLLTRVIDIPIHLGVSINDSYKEIDDWMSTRNKEWSNRLRQQVCSLVVQQPGDEEARIQLAKDQLLAEIVSVLESVYPPLKHDPKKIENLIQRTLKLNLAVKGQEIKIERLSVDEGKSLFDPTTMKATAKGKPNGIVFLSITPTFVARDELDNEHGFTVPGKVFCVETDDENVIKSSDNDDTVKSDESNQINDNDESVKNSDKDESAKSSDKDESVKSSDKDDIAESYDNNEDKDSVDIIKKDADNANVL
ncbi:hypothetical protein HPULCUR_004001 [Helicostylum pulchrum]|uniref:Uncharacterized protein n=1 Tax=Helicostylum pulchrum TaxID=562976 RepID=A0ABP9XV57_9FUNG